MTVKQYGDAGESAKVLRVARFGSRAGARAVCFIPLQLTGNSCHPLLPCRECGETMTTRLRVTSVLRYCLTLPRSAGTSSPRLQ